MAIGDETVRAVPGTFVSIPPGAAQHRKHDKRAGARIMTVSPPGHEHLFQGACGVGLAIRAARSESNRRASWSLDIEQISVASGPQVID